MAKAGTVSKHSSTKNCGSKSLEKKYQLDIFPSIIMNYYAPRLHLWLLVASLSDSLSLAMRTYSSFRQVSIRESPPLPILSSPLLSLTQLCFSRWFFKTSCDLSLAPIHSTPILHIHPSSSLALCTKVCVAGAKAIHTHTVGRQPPAQQVKLLLLLPFPLYTLTLHLLNLHSMVFFTHTHSGV